MKGLVRNWKVVLGIVGFVFCVGVGCLGYFWYSGWSKFGGVQKFGDVSGVEFGGESFGVEDESSLKDGESNVGDGKGSNKSGEGEVIYVHIVGEVKNQGVICLVKGQRIVDAIEKAGGVTELADLGKVNLAFVLSDGQKVRIPSVDDEGSLNEDYVSVDGGNNVVSGGGGSSVRRININTASQTELETITGVGPSLAAKIISYREKNGKFKSVDELRNVSGIGDAKFEALKDFVEV